MNTRFLTEQIEIRKDTYEHFLKSDEFEGLDLLLKHDLIYATVQNQNADVATINKYGLKPCQHDKLVDYGICVGCGRRMV